jgi:soluble lytic murein transglycosylase-like protein
MKSTAIAMLILAATSVHAEKFSAADVPNAGIKQRGKIVVRNDSRSITAYRFFGDIREALVSLRSMRSTSFGSALFNSRARVSAPMPAELSSMIEEAGRTHGVDPRLVAAVAGRESAFNPRAVSRVGACGIMQLMPATARFLGLSDVFNPRDNVFAGTRYLRTLLNTFHGDLDLTLAAYNAGPGAVQRYNGVPPYRETQEYVRVVRAAYERSIQ